MRVASFEYIGTSTHVDYDTYWHLDYGYTEGRFKEAPCLSHLVFLSYYYNVTLFFEKCLVWSPQLDPAFDKF